MKKEKPCKGIGKAHGVKGCGKVTAYRTYGLCDSCRADFLLNDERGKIILQKATLKATAPRIKAQNDLKDALLNKKARTSHSALIQQTQKLVNKYVRLRDRGKNCISQLIPYKDDFDAGHCFPVKGYEGLRFDLDNIHGQSINANRFLEGDHINYLVNLPTRIGEQRTRELIQRAKDYKRNGYKFSRPELLEIQANIKQKIKELK